MNFEMGLSHRKENCSCSNLSLETSSRGELEFVQMDWLQLIFCLLLTFLHTCYCSFLLIA
ncbi:hypothetical protein BDZ45DRAFT_204093 [Acephala macrosclerotiorum]|nr:hypothetical protein BDZ45DRAFT_204093 [Acephala macrosclerotiorum]